MVLRLLLFFWGCSAISCLRYSPNRLERKEYLGDEIRIDGYYFHQEEVSTVLRSSSGWTSVLVFFRDGYVISNNYSTVDFAEIEKTLIGDRTPRKSLEGSGYYQIDGRELLVEFWPFVAEVPIPTVRVNGKILSRDSLTLNIYGRNENDIWHFRPLTVKPDSTTIYDEQLKTGKSFKGYVGKPVREK